ncbi:MAG: DUF2271 domain-containing protein [Spirochaetia bacterium]|nr:DUF2271 domain-containing protein [Spirochaetia bacterium]
MKIKRFCIVSIILLLIIGVLPLGAQSSDLAVFIEPGDNYTHWKWFGIFPRKLTPQIAVWIENDDERIVQTLMVSRREGEDSWIGAKEGRPEALPVFSHKTKNAELDDVTSATPKGKEGFSVVSGETLPKGKYFIFAEVNASFDYNSAYPEVEGDVNGQPSLIYRAELDLGQEIEDITLIPIGTGAVKGETGDIFPGVDGLTTALSILSTLTVRRNF